MTMIRMIISIRRVVSGIFICSVGMVDALLYGFLGRCQCLHCIKSIQQNLPVRARG